MEKTSLVVRLYWIVTPIKDLALLNISGLCDITINCIGFEASAYITSLNLG